MAQWNFDPAHTSATFSARHMMVSTVRGKFTNVSGQLEFDPNNPAATQVTATIEAASLETGVEDRDNHLRSADFLDVANYPSITFKSTLVDITSENTARMVGNLTIRGVTKPVTVDVEYLGQMQSPFGQEVVGFVGSAKINREDWGLTWNMALETGGVLVGKDIRIDLDLEAIQVTEAAAV